MTDVVLVVQKSNAQNEIWSKILASQGLVVITESAQADLKKLLQQGNEDDQTFPKLIILEMSIDKLNPYDFCRWVQEAYPALKVILTAQERTNLSEIEQRWAKNQGAHELLAGFDYTNLPLSLTQAITVVMLALGKLDWEEESLVPVIEALTQEYGQVREERTFIQESETLIQDTPSDEETSMIAASHSSGTTANKRRNVKLKPKIKRFRGLPY